MSKYSDFYKEYLSSPAWAKKRDRVLKRDNYLCQSCLDATATEVHHKSYLHLGDEPLFDLESVCPPCHKRLTMIAMARAKCTNLEQQLEQMFLVA